MSELKYIRHCEDHCEIYLQTTSNQYHYAQLRCRTHGYLRWVSREQALQLEPELANPYEITDHDK